MRYEAGSGGGGSFEQEFIDLCGEVNGLFQELRANEEAVEALTRVDDRRRTLAEDGSDYDWTPTSVTFPGTYSFSASSINTSDRWIEVCDLRWDGFESRAQDHVDAVSGVLSIHDGDCSFLCPNILASDLSALSGACESLNDASADLWRLVDGGNDSLGTNSQGAAINMPGFVAQLQQAWPATSLSSTSFYDFYGALAAAGDDYSTATQRLAGTSAAVAGIIAQYRVNVLDIASAALDGARSALKTWQDNQGPTFVSQYSAFIDEEGFKVLDGVSTGLGVLGRIPGVGSTLTAIPNKIVKGARLVGRLELPTAYETVTSSDELHRNFHASLEQAEKQMMKALDHLMTSDQAPVTADGRPADADGDGKPDTTFVPPFDGFVRDAENDASWDLPDVEF